MRLVVPHRWVCYATWTGLVLAWNGLAAQTVVPGTDPLANSALPAPDLTQDRTSQQRFQAAGMALEKGDLVRAGELVRWLVELPEDRWFGTGAHRQGIRRELFRQLAAWPENLRELYATDIASRASPDLQLALQNHDVDGLLRIAARYPDSEPGRLALRRAALHCFDRGDFAAAATISARSLPPLELARADDLPIILHNAAARWRMGDHARARAGLQLYSRLFDVKSPANADARINAALASFRDSRAGREGEKLTGLTFPGVQPRWSVPVLNDKTWNELFEVANQDLRNSGMPTLPAAIPCVTDQLVLLRTYASLAAFDLQTGKPVWECSALSDSAEPRQRAQTFENAGFRDFKGQELLRYLVQNQVTGSCVADQQQAYFIGEKQRVINDDQQYPRPRNQLVACRLSDGTITWQSWLQPELSDIYFLSQPIIQGGRLYLLGETESQLKLVVLKCADGRLEWQMPLASIKQDLLLHPGRKLRQLPVLWQDGWLICPTGSGCILSIDTVTRNYEWAYRYVNREVVPKAPGRFGAFAEPTRVVPLGGWQRIGLARDARRVYFVTPEADSIQALDAQTGQLAWEQPRGDGLYLGGLVGDKLLIVGDRALRGLHAETGAVVWQREIDRPSGIGLLHGSEYLLPLSSGSVLLVDVSTGRTLRGAQGSQAPLGNLVQHAGSLVSLTPQRLEVYGAWETEHQELLTHLMRKPDDPDLLGQLYRQMRRGGDVAQVAALLRELYRQQPQPTLRVQLIRTLLELVATRPELKTEIVPEIGPLVGALGDAPDELRCRIQAGVVLDDRPAALGAAIKLAAQASMEEFEAGIDKQTLVRSDRALQGVILQLLHETPEAARPALEKNLDDTLQGARDSSDPFALQRFALQFSHLRWGQQARLSDHTRVGIGWPAFRQELSLLDLTDGPDQTLAAAAFLKLAQEMNQRSFRQDAIRYFATLRDEFPDVRLDPAHTVSQIIAELPAMSLLTAQLKAGPVDPWPLTKPAISKPKGKPREPFLMPIPIEAPPGSLLDRVNVTVDLNASRLLCQGDWYPGYWEIPLPKSRSPLRELIQTYHGWGLGQLLVVRLGTQLYGVSLLDNTGEPNGRVVWTFDLADDLTGRFEVGQVQNRQGLGEAEVVIFDDYGREVGQMCVIQPGYFCYRHRGELVVVETATGRVLWRRRNQPPGLQIAGDSQSLYLLHAQDKTLETLRIVDGSSERRVPWPYPVETRPLFHGGVAIVSEPDNQALRLRWVRLRDLLVLAEHPLGKISHRMLLDSQTLAVLQQDHTLVWFDLRGGQLEGRAVLDVPGDVSRVHAWQDQQRFYVLPSGIPPYRGSGRVPQIRDGHRQHRVHGTLHAIDRRTGTVSWKRTLEDVIFPLEQPHGAPIFMLNYRTLAMGVSEPSKPPVPGEMEGVLHVLDRRTGEDVYREQSPNLSPAFTVEINLEQHSLDIHGEQMRLRLEYPSN